MANEAQDDQQEYIFQSKLPDIDIPNHLPLHTYCFQNVSQFASRPCIINGPTGATYTYDEVHRTSKRVAVGLHKLGIRKGDVIMLLLQNCPEFVIAFLGASYIGAASTTANPFCNPAEIRRQAEASKPKLIITEAVYAEKVEEFCEESGGNVRVMCVDHIAPVDGCLHFFELTTIPDDDDEIEAVISGVEIDPLDVVALPYSSGTTGLPKGVMLTHRGLITSVAQQVDGENPNFYLHADDVIICVLPLFHIYSLNSVMLCALRVGATILIMQRFEINSLLELVQRYKVTIAPFVPPIMLTISKSPVVGNYDLSSIRMVMSGAAPMKKELEDSVRAILPDAIIGQGYGMTEAGPVLSMCLGFAKEPFEAKSGTCGTVVRNAEMKILKPETTISLPRNERGEICIRGDQLMKGYLNDPEATERTIDKEGWLHTGDVGYINDDDEITIVDRLKELIKYKGFQVAPAELEALLVAHDEILDAAVVSIDEDIAGELPVAFVVRADNSEITEEEIKEFISKQVASYKRITRVFFTDEIPKAPSGKILRKVLRAKLLTELSD